MANFSCGHKPWMGVSCEECRPIAGRTIESNEASEVMRDRIRALEACVAAADYMRQEIVEMYLCPHSDCTCVKCVAATAYDAARQGVKP